MPQIVIEIPIDALSRLAVAHALAELTLALGGHAVETPLHVAAPVKVANDARLVPTSPVADDDKPVEVLPDEQKFNRWVDTLETSTEVKAVCTSLQEAGPQGLSIEQVREKFPSGTTNRRVAGVLTALIFRCPQRCGFSPVVKVGDSYRWVGFPTA